MKRGVEFPGHNKLNAVIERQLAMLRQKQTPRCLACQNGTTKNPQTCWIRKGTGAPPPNRRRKQTPELSPEPTPSQPGTPPTSTGNTSEAQSLEIVNLQARYVYTPTSLPCAESFTIDRSAQDSVHDTDYDPDMLPDEGTSTG